MKKKGTFFTLLEEEGKKEGGGELKKTGPIFCCLFLPLGQSSNLPVQAFFKKRKVLEKPKNKKNRASRGIEGPFFMLYEPAFVTAPQGGGKGGGGLTCVGARGLNEFNA